MIRSAGHYLIARPPTCARRPARVPTQPPPGHATREPRHPRFYRTRKTREIIAMSDDDWETDADFENTLTEEQQRRAGSVAALTGLQEAKKAGGLTSMETLRKGLSQPLMGASQSSSAAAPPRSGPPPREVTPLDWLCVTAIQVRSRRGVLVLRVFLFCAEESRCAHAFWWKW